MTQRTDPAAAASDRQRFWIVPTASRQGTHHLWVATIALLMLLGAGGCGSQSPPAETEASSESPATAESFETASDGDDEAVADAPTDSAAETGPPPGGFELPSDFDPNQTGDASQHQPSSGGLELPPDDDGASGAATAAAGETLTAQPQAAGQDDTQPVRLKTASWEEIQSVVTKTGRLTVLDVWSLACEPCLKEFPGLVEIDKQLGDRVTCFSVSVDFDGRRTKPPETYRPEAEKFLQSTGAEFQSFLSATPSDDVLAAIDVISIPAVIILDAEGQVVRTFTDAGDDAGFTYEENVTPLVKKLLADDR